MEEKIIEAKFQKNKITISLYCISVVLLFVGIVSSHATYLNGEGYKSFGFGSGGTYYYTIIYDSFVEFFISVLCFECEGFLGMILYLPVILIFVALFLGWEMNHCALTITNRRVSGKASFGKGVELPINQISAIGLGICNRISIATSSGRIHFWLVDNRDDVHNKLAELIGKVQEETTIKAVSASVSNADELKKYKELLDSGVISQEEFDSKKKQLLGL